MVRRSVMFSPGDRPELMRKAPGTGADTVVFDLEDAVAPGRKAEAREHVRELLTDAEFDPDCEVCVRVNPPASGMADDVEALAGDLRLDALMLPKVAGAADVDQLDEAFPGETPPVLALVESAAGVLAAGDIGSADATDALVFGAEDLSADIGATRTDEGTEVLYAREKVVVAAAAHGLDAIDTVYTDFSDSEGLADETDFAIQLGYDGKMAIHPSQVPVINDAFTPAADRIEWAQAVLDARDEADAEGRGVFQVDGEMIDAPLIAQAERVLARARAAGRI
ncbi:HpcH/HpaI aldolase/citrate lyase family protein [Haloarchaeobius amylolyticus]|uniref:HpcH/HpaI aldolase/citrate lyase family protein n=1 Tax=Haloarchaeobius amylolyticus TaxID=1198296 RepID=UPI00226EB4D6|nr:CoA ester lyase [Haloarchaeobius amylolyticus]